jgi:hypothetical protein
MREDYAEPSGMDDFPGWQFDTAAWALILVACWVVGVLAERELLH